MQRHQPVCRCTDGYIGNPLVQCRRPPIHDIESKCSCNVHITNELPEKGARLNPQLNPTQKSHVIQEILVDHHRAEPIVTVVCLATGRFARVNRCTSAHHPTVIRSVCRMRIVPEIDRASINVAQIRVPAHVAIMPNAVSSITIQCARANMDSPVIRSSSVARHRVGLIPVGWISLHQSMSYLSDRRFVPVPYYPFHIAIIEHEQPTNPCVPSPCGGNANCRVVDGRPVCACIGNYIGRPPYCRPECMVNSDCASNMACQNERCTNPCIGSCGPNTDCHVQQHVPRCQCGPGFSGDPYSGCVRHVPSKPKEMIVC